MTRMHGIAALVLGIWLAIATPIPTNAPNIPPPPATKAVVTPAQDPFLHLNGHLVGGSFRHLYESTPYSLVAFGYPTSDEMQAQVTDVSPDGVDAHSVTRTRTIQYFERAIFIYEPENGFPWDTVSAQLTQLIGD